MRLLGLGLENAVPDATTVWLFREALAKPGLVMSVFAAETDAPVHDSQKLKQLPNRSNPIQRMVRGALEPFSASCATAQTTRSRERKVWMGCKSLGRTREARKVASVPWRSALPTFLFEKNIVLCRIKSRRA